MDRVDFAIRRIVFCARSEGFRGLALVVLVSFLSMACVAQAPPIADTYVASGLPNKNYGANTTLAIQNGITSYVKFNLSGMPSGATVSRAILTLYVDAVTAGGTFDVYQVNGPWTENGLTYNTRPALGSSATGNQPISLTAANAFLVIDITSLVQSWLNGSVTNYGVAMVLIGTSGSFSFDSKESTTYSHAPQLVVYFNGPTGPQGPQGPQGATGLSGPQGPQGPNGPPGPAGATGPIGSQGVQGPTGPAGANGASFNFRSAFNNSAAYGVNDVVTYSGSTYIAITGNQGPSNPTPDVNSAAWSVMAQQGGTGPAGPQGPAGGAGLMGPQGPVGMTGSSGPQGVQGPTGGDGVSFNFRSAFDSSAAYAVNDVVTYSGSTYIAIAGNQGPSNPTPDVNSAAWSVMAQQGGTGPAGPQGPAGGAGPMGPAGATGPQGPVGTTGPSGPQGVQGPAGPSISGLSSDGANGISVVGGIKTGSGPTSIGVMLQPGTSCPVPVGADAALCVGNDSRLHCTLSAAKGGGPC
jgi:hypothetical protein